MRPARFAPGPCVGLQPFARNDMFLSTILGHLRLLIRRRLGPIIKPYRKGTSKGPVAVPGRSG